MDKFATALEKPNEQVLANVEHGVVNCMRKVLINTWRYNNTTKVTRDDFIFTKKATGKPCCFDLINVSNIEHSNDKEYGALVYFKGKEEPWVVNYFWQDLLWIWLDYKKNQLPANTKKIRKRI